MCEGFYPIKAKGEIYVLSPVYLGLFILIYSVLGQRILKVLGGAFNWTR